MSPHKTYQDLLHFWFGTPESDLFTTVRSAWFQKNPDFDAEIRDQFAPLLSEAAEGNLFHWEEEPWSALALVILLDQLPRNIFRGSPQAYLYDARALETAKQSIQRGFDQQVPAIQRSFFYLPFQHSESLDDQEESLLLHNAPGALEAYQSYAQQHYEIIKRFGRFPHRNKVLGRESTSEEKAFLQQPGSSF